MQMLWRAAGFASILDWYAGQRWALERMQEGILTVACWYHRRFSMRLAQPLFSLVPLADMRHPDPMRQSIWQNFASTQPCCLSAGMATRLHASHWQRPAIDVCRDESMLHMLTWFARLWTLQVADVEWHHSQNRHRSNLHGQTGVAQLSAKFVNTEAQASHAKFVCELSMLRARQVKGGTNWVATKQVITCF